MAQELSVFFLREMMSFLIPKNAPDLDVPVEFDIFFSQSKYVRGDEDEDLDAKGVPTVPYPLAYPSKLRNMNGKYRKILTSFYRGPVTTPPGHSDFCKTSHHSCQLSAFHPPVFAVFQVQHFLRMFWKKKILKNLGHQDHTQTEEMASPQFLRWGGIFLSCILKGAFLREYR